MKNATILLLCFVFLSFNVFSQLPTAFDLRSSFPVGVTSVKDQDPNGSGCGSCWAHAAAASIESFCILNGFTYDVSEDNIIDCHGFVEAPCAGGSYYMVNALYSRHGGPFDETTDAYTPASKDCPIRFVFPFAYFEDMRFLPATASVIKQYIYDVGAVASTMFFVAANYNSTSSQYYDASLSTSDYSYGHCVTIVGWDDNMAIAKAPSVGAWIVKDSYGLSHGNNGYVYVSYHDAGLTQFDNVGFPVMHELPPSKNMASPYYHDFYGWIDNRGFSSNVAYALAKYTVGNNGSNAPQQIKRIGTWAVEDNTTVSVEVYTSFASGNLSGLVGAATQICPYKGHYSIPFESETFPLGTDLYIKVRYSAPSGTLKPIPVEMVEAGHTPASIGLSNNECWISANGSTWQAIGQNTTNAFDLCVKMYAENAPLSQISGNVSPVCEMDYVNMSSSAILAGDGVEWLLNGTSLGSSPMLNEQADSRFSYGVNTIKLVAYYGHNTDTASVSVVVNQLPSVMMDDFDPPEVSSSLAPFTLPAAYPSGGVYSGLGVAGDQFDPSVGVGSYEVVYTYLEAITGCSASASSSVDVFLPTGFDDVRLSSLFSVSPNPAKDYISIVSPVEQGFEVIIWNIQGKVIFRDKDLDRVDISAFDAGVYIVEFTVEDKSAFVRFVK